MRVFRNKPKELYNNSHIHNLDFLQMFCYILCCVLNAVNQALPLTSLLGTIFFSVNAAILVENMTHLGKIRNSVKIKKTFLIECGNLIFTVHTQQTNDDSIWQCYNLNGS